MLRRHIWWLAPLGGGSSPNSTPKTSQKQLHPAAAALAFQRAVTDVVRRLSPSVVQIQSPDGLGSGVVFDSNGDIVTNNHVVAGGGPYTVTAGAHSYGASLVGRFPPDDLAVVRVSGAKLTPAAFADSSKLDVGDFAIAIGNPLGLRSSVTDGIVSAFRQGVSEGNGVALPLMIQTGGALADLQGRVIGIPTLAATDPELGGTAAPGIGFAIPSNLVKDIATQIIRFGHVVKSHRAYLGVQIGDTNGAGVLVQGVTKGGPAAKAGLVSGDVITSVNSHQTPTVDDLTSVVSELKPGTAVTLAVVTQRGAHKTLRLTLGTFPGG